MGRWYLPLLPSGSPGAWATNVADPGGQVLRRRQASAEDRTTDTEDEPRAACGRVPPADRRDLRGVWFKDALTCPCPETIQPLFFSQFFSEQTSLMPGFSEATLQSSRPPNTSGFLLSGLRCSPTLCSGAMQVHTFSTPWASLAAKRLPHPSEALWVAVQGLASSFPHKRSHIILFCPRGPVSEEDREGIVQHCKQKGPRKLS